MTTSGNASGDHFPLQAISLTSNRGTPVPASDEPSGQHVRGLAQRHRWILDSEQLTDSGGDSMDVYSVIVGRYSTEETHLCRCVLVEIWR